MKEDRDFCLFVKNRLEDGIPGDAPPRMDQIVRIAAQESFARIAGRRSRRRWAASLVAASFAAALLLPAFLPSRESVVSATYAKPVDTVAGVIDILRMGDGMESEAGELSIAEKLLSWQDAPYESAIADMQ